MLFYLGVLSLLAELDKADRAFCFTSGMAALAAVTHLIGTGAHFTLFESLFSNVYVDLFMTIVSY